MMKKLKKLLPVLVIIFFGLILFFSFILLNRNDFGVFEMNDKIYVNISSNNSSKTYKKGSIVILNKTKLKELKKGQEVFLYKQNEKTKVVQLISSKVKEVDLERSVIIATHDGKYYSEKFIAGVPDKIIPFWGGFFELVLSKWFFFIFILIPAFLIVVYEVYLLFISIKYGDQDDEDDADKDKKDKLEDKKEELPKENKEEVKNVEVFDEKKEENTSIDNTLEEKKEEEVLESTENEVKNEEVLDNTKNEVKEENNDVINVDVEELNDINDKLEEEKKEDETEELVEDEKKK